MISTKDDTTLEITRILHAPIARVFSAWTSREEWQAWIGPEGIDCDVPILEARVGGRYRVGMHLPNGATMNVVGEFRTIEKPTRLVFTWGAENDPEKQSLVTITLKETHDGTEMTLRHEGLGTPDNRDAHARGWDSALDKFGRHVEQGAQR